MKNNTSMIYSLALVIGDFVALIAAFTVAYILRVQIDSRPLVNAIPALTFIKAFFTLIPLWIFVFAYLGLYNNENYDRRFPEFSRLLVGSAIGIMIIIAYDFTQKNTIFPARLVPLYAFGLAFIFLLIERGILRFIRKLFFASGKGINSVLLIGNSPFTTEIAEFLGDTKTSGYYISGIYSSKAYLPEKIKAMHYASLDSALSALKNINTIVQTELYEDNKINQRIMEAARDNHISYKFIPANSTLYTGNNTVELFHNFPVIAVHQTSLIGWGRVAKRLFDIFGSVIGMIVCIPIFVVVGIIIKILDPKGPIFFKHSRVSRFGTTFNAYKMRSMYQKYSGSKKSAEEIFKSLGREDLITEWRQNQKVRYDPRVIKYIGNFIRRSSIDELPQLWNVFLGELSLIGPRPVTAAELERYAEKSSLFLSIKPGITGLWQVSGRNNLSYDERIELDLYYIQHWSFLLDLKIIYRTVIVMLTGKGQ